ncbi:hypothetical protein SAMN06296273_0709 [Nitrosomonas ureae]|uniref:Uncharacterized protein n=1 Tax=Nitrosomonas ureae TaxID=44577 RepID=A0A285BVM1_9PROT|nr:hypothetical protein [Nitrosomonas ureae]SNX59269.1 hypothetical protein SAMN06296273_0709 [Nitrosomonas ureae]
MKITAEKFREARKKYLESLSQEDREEIERRKRKAEIESKKRWEELKEVFKPIHKLYEDNLHHIKARDILKDAIQAAIDNPDMTPEVKESGELFILLLEETGDSFKYDSDAVMEPVVKIARVEIPSKGGLKRAKNDPRSIALKEIENEAISRAEQFKRHGYQASFVREMLDKYRGVLSDDKAIISRLNKLKKTDKIRNCRKNNHL